MANEYSVNQSDLVLVADAIRTKNETTEELEFPAGFVEAIEGIKGGGDVTAKAYASEDVLPTSADDGEIAVISTTAAENVYVQSAEPSEPATGDLWITYSASGNHPANAGNVIVYPTNAYQYAEGSWAKIPMFIWGNGRWNSAIMYLLNADDECVDITGGWDVYGEASAMATKTSKGFDIYAQNTGYQRAGIQTKQAIDISEYSRIIFVGKVVSYYGYYPSHFGIQTEKASAVGEIVNTAAKVAVTKAGEYRLTLDVTSYSGSYYVGILSGSQLEVTQIIME